MLCHKQHFIQDIKNINCLIYLESELIIKSKIIDSHFIVFVESIIYTKKKALFLSAKSLVNIYVKNFYEEIKTLNLSYNCFVIL